MASASYSSSILSRRPTQDATRCRLCSVTRSLAGSSNRSTCGRLVPMRAASALLVRPCDLSASSSCQISTRLVAIAVASSRRPSSPGSLRGSIRCAGCSSQHLLHSTDRQLELGGRCLARLLDETMNRTKRPSAMQKSSLAIRLPVSPHAAPKALGMHGTTQRHADRPAELEGAQIVTVISRSRSTRATISDRLLSGARA